MTFLFRSGAWGSSSRDRRYQDCEKERFEIKWSNIKLRIQSQGRFALPEVFEAGFSEPDQYQNHKETSQT